MIDEESSVSEIKEFPNRDHTTFGVDGKYVGMAMPGYKVVAVAEALPSAIRRSERDDYQIKAAAHQIEKTGKWAFDLIEKDVMKTITPEFEMIHSLRHSLRDLYRIVTTETAAPAAPQQEPVFTTADAEALCELAVAAVAKCNQCGAPVKVTKLPDGNGFIRYAAPQATVPEATPTAIDEIAAERQRQIKREYFVIEHDEEHIFGELARAAATYAAHAARYNSDPLGELINKDVPPKTWPWEAEWWKPKDARRDLIRAGALIVAELERLERQLKRSRHMNREPL